MGSDIGGVSEAEKGDFFVRLIVGPGGLMRIRQVRGPAPERRSGTERPTFLVSPAGIEPAFGV